MQIVWLTVGNFKFLTQAEIQTFDLFSIKADAEIGYIIECDLTYPAHLHDSHNDYPLAAEHLTVTRQMLSPFVEFARSDPSVETEQEISTKPSGQV